MQVAAWLDPPTSAYFHLEPNLHDNRSRTWRVLAHLVPAQISSFTRTSRRIFLVIQVARERSRSCFTAGLLYKRFEGLLQVRSSQHTQPSILRSAASLTMQFTLVLAIFAAFAAVGVSHSDTNARRMARGLPPLPPVKRTPVEGAQPLILSIGT
jgi:hypothetical protein